MKPKTKTIIILLVTFLLGILCGWFLEERIIGEAHHGRGRDKKDFVIMLTEKLKLDSMQIMKVDSILEMNKKKMEVFKKHALTMRDTIRAEIKKILNPEQLKIFEEINQNAEKQEAKRGEKEPEKK